MTDHDVAVAVDATAEAASVLGMPADAVGDAQERWAEQLVEQRRGQDVNPIGPGGLLADVTSGCSSSAPRSK